MKLKNLAEKVLPYVKALAEGEEVEWRWKTLSATSWTKVDVMDTVLLYTSESEFELRIQPKTVDVFVATWFTPGENVGVAYGDDRTAMVDKYERFPGFKLDVIKRELP